MYGRQDGDEKSSHERPHFFEAFCRAVCETIPKTKNDSRQKITNRNPNPQINHRRNAVSQRFKKKSINTETVHTTKIREAGNETPDKMDVTDAKKEKKTEEKIPLASVLVGWLMSAEQRPPAAVALAGLIPFPSKMLLDFKAY